MGERTSSRVVRFSPQEANCLWGNEARYFLLATGTAAPIMANSRCAHRGGPLHLGTLSPDQSKVICPMHGLSTRVASLHCTALPMIVRTDETVVIVPESEEALFPRYSHTGYVKSGKVVVKQGLSDQQGGVPR